METRHNRVEGSDKLPHPKPPRHGGPHRAVQIFVIRNRELNRAKSQRLDYPKYIQWIFSERDRKLSEAQERRRARQNALAKGSHTAIPHEASFWLFHPSIHSTSCTPVSNAAKPGVIFGSSLK